MHELQTQRIVLIQIMLLKLKKMCSLLFTLLKNKLWELKCSREELLCK